MTKTSSGNDRSDLSARADFVEAWRLVESAQGSSTNTRARAFAVWVGLFQFLDDTDTVKLNATEIAKTFSVTRATWQTYREMLTEVGVIEQTGFPGDADTHRRMRVRLSPPLLPTE